ncbi:MAG: ROK family protein, partial [Mollicutes bacterium]|nr:ROK family protein [Mollicutes bacterium]
VKTDGETHHLDDFASLRVIQEKVSKTKGKNLSLSEIYDLFQQGDEEVRKEVGISARSVGKALKEIIRVFDIDQFILSGGITNFGDFYLRIVQEETKRANENAIVRFSHLNNYAICDGAKERGITKVLSSALNNLKTQ